MLTKFFIKDTLIRLSGVALIIYGIERMRKESFQQNIFSLISIIVFMLATVYYVSIYKRMVFAPMTMEQYYSLLLSSLVLIFILYYKYLYRKVAFV